MRHSALFELRRTGLFTSCVSTPCDAHGEGAHRSLKTAPHRGVHHVPIPTVGGVRHVPIPTVGGVREVSIPTVGGVRQVSIPTVGGVRQ
eukprot:1217556-Pyramimonas_sp.AAC.1